MALCNLETTRGQGWQQMQSLIDTTRQMCRSRQSAQQAATLTVAQQESRQLPLWSESVRGIPNTILRSALFGAIKRGRRMYMQGEVVASFEDVTILQTGPRLDQADLDVWEECLHLARIGGLGTRIQFAAHGFLKAIGRDTGKSQHEWLKDAFRRLTSTVVEIKCGKHAYFGSMLHHGARDDETGHYCIEINPAIVSLYGSDGWTAVEFARRRALKGQPLAQWLFCFYSSHSRPYPVKVSSILRWSGSETSELKRFRQRLRDVLTRLEAVTGWAWEIDDNDLLHIHKEPRKRVGRCG